MYAPIIKSARCIRRYRLTPFSFQIFSEIENFSLIQYLYILAATRDGETQPCLFVASEDNVMDGLFGEPASHFLGIFSGWVHSSLGASNDWADLELFTTRALNEAAKRLGFSGTPERID